MAFSVFDSRGTPLDRQRFTWRDMVRQPISKLDDDAFTRMRVILMNGIELEALRFSHMAARCNMALRVPLAEVRRSEQHQATLVNWLLAPDHSPLEITIAYEQLAIELTAAVARAEPDAYLAQVYRFGLLEDFDHLYRYAALLDRVEGKDANNILQSYTDILPGRPTPEHHRAPRDDVRMPYDRSMTAMLSKLHALTITASEAQTHNYYMNVGPVFADPVARQLYAEIASVEEQHVTQYGSLLDPTETWLEQWLLHEANECYTYYSCVETLLLREAIERLGGDPTAQTPSADVGGVEAGGLLQVLHDPRTSLAQSLHALLTAELSDHAGWETLVALAQAASQDDLATSFSDALNQEERASGAGAYLVRSGDRPGAGNSRGRCICVCLCVCRCAWRYDAARCQRSGAAGCVDGAHRQSRRHVAGCATEGQRVPGRYLSGIQHGVVESTPGGARALRRRHARLASSSSAVQL